MSPQYWSLNTPHEIDSFLIHAAKLRAKGQSVCVKFESPESHISQKQVNALNLWCRQVAEYLCQCGLDMKEIVSVEIPATEHLVKENLYKPVLESMTGKKSTMEQSTTQPSEVAEVLARHFAQKHGVTLPFWPSREHHNG